MHPLNLTRSPNFRFRSTLSRSCPIQNHPSPSLSPNHSTPIRNPSCPIHLSRCHWTPTHSNRFRIPIQNYPNQRCRSQSCPSRSSRCRWIPTRSNRFRIPIQNYPNQRSRSRSCPIRSSRCPSNPNHPILILKSPNPNYPTHLTPSRRCPIRSSQFRSFRNPIHSLKPTRFRSCFPTHCWPGRALDC